MKYPAVITLTCAFIYSTAKGKLSFRRVPFITIAAVVIHYNFLHIISCFAGCL